MCKLLSVWRIDIQEKGQQYLFTVGSTELRGSLYQKQKWLAMTVEVILIVGMHKMPYRNKGVRWG